jgi:hypothetical protein
LVQNFRAAGHTSKRLGIFMLIWFTLLAWVPELRAIIPYWVPITNILGVAKQCKFMKASLSNKPKNQVVPSGNGHGHNGHGANGAAYNNGDASTAGPLSPSQHQARIGGHSPINPSKSNHRLLGSHPSSSPQDIASSSHYHHLNTPPTTVVGVVGVSVNGGNGANSPPTTGPLGSSNEHRISMKAVAPIVN